MNESFCPLPFIHFATLPTGKVRLCCKTLDNHVDLDLNDSTIDDIWNSDYYKNIRKNMLNNDFPKACEVCYNEDNAGKRSMRIKELEIWENSTSLKNALDSYEDGKIATKPIYLDLRMGNLCNLQCRTCDPVSSSQIHKEGKKVKNAPSFFYNKMQQADEIKEWWEDTKFKDNLNNLLPDAELLWLSGGEPTLVAEGHRLIQKCIDDGIAEKIKLRYVVNLTNITDKFVSNFLQFKGADFHTSLDGVGKVNDYLRYPSDFETLTNNLAKLCNSGASNVYLINTVSNLNLYRLPEMINWMNDFNKGKLVPAKLNINPLNKPDLFHFSLLDDNLKKEITDTFENFKSTSKIENELKTLIKLMQQTKTNKEKLQKDFFSYINTIDKIRNQCIIEVLPELTNFYNSCKIIARK